MRQRCAIDYYPLGWHKGGYVFGQAEPPGWYVFFSDGTYSGPWGNREECETRAREAEKCATQSR